MRPQIAGYLLLEGDNRGLPDREVGADGLAVGRWRRYETESYLVHPEALRRYVEREVGPLFASAGSGYLADQLPAVVLREPRGDHDYLNRTPASKTLIPGFLKAAQVSLRKNEYYLIAEQMKPEEIPPEVGEKLDDIAAALGLDV